VIAATPATIALDPATVITAGGYFAYLLAVKRRTLIVRGLSNVYDGGMTTKPVAADVDRLSLERQVCFAPPMLTRLHALGLLTRLRSATDQRATKVELTTKGRTLRRRALKIRPAVVERLAVHLSQTAASGVNIATTTKEKKWHSKKTPNR
jgi:hypothetical protein